MPGGFEQEVDTGVLSGPHFDAYVEELSRHRRVFHDKTRDNPLFTGGPRSDIDEAVLQLPDADVTEKVFVTLERMPQGDYEVMGEAIGVFTRMERENADAAASIVDTTTNTTNVRH